MLAREQKSRLNSLPCAPVARDAVLAGMSTFGDSMHEREDTASLSTAISLVSGSRLLRDGLAKLLAGQSGFRVVGSYSDAPDPAIERPNPLGHVVLLDVGMGREAALAWTHYWRGLTPPALVVVMELGNDLDAILACIEAGAGGYTLQGASLADVLAAVREVRQGIARCSPEVTSALFRRLAARTAGTPPPACTAPLTERELQVLRCIADDLSNQQIADQLVIELCTVKHHVHSILEKLKLRTRWDAARLANERGWLRASAALPTSPTEATRYAH